MTIPRQLVLFGCLLLAACNGDTAEPPAYSASQPNILFILVDDMGYNDLGINSGVPGLTPHLNHFAAEGVRFTRNYVDSTCAATRAGILTGTYPASRGFRPGGLGISPEVLTLPRALRRAGYSTHHVGKWHLGHAARQAWPKAQGFDTFYGFLSQFLLEGPHRDGVFKFGRPTYLNPWLQQGDEFPRPQQGHLSELLLAKMLEFLDEARTLRRPWFMNFWTFLPHEPLKPPERYAANFTNDRTGRYRASIVQLDEMLGKILEALERNGLRQSTLVLIASDNGGAKPEIGSNQPFSGKKMSFQEGGVRTPLLMRWPGGRWAGTVRDEVVSYLDYMPTLVAAAGGEVPEGMPGRDLGLLLEGGDLPKRALYWEASGFRANSWGLLSEDGRWRVHRFFGAEPILNDLVADPTGSIDVSASEPGKLQQLHNDFLDWRWEQRRVHLRYERDAANGRGRLVGESMQRAPGVGGFTFAAGLVPRVGFSGGQDAQYIAGQEGYWRLVQRGGVLELEMGALRLSSPGLDSGACTPLVVTAQYSHQLMLPNRGEAAVSLFLNGQEVASGYLSRPSLPQDDYEKATLLGQDERGRSYFKGDILNPMILNERLFAKPDPWFGNSVQRVSEDLCKR